MSHRRKQKQEIKNGQQATQFLYDLFDLQVVTKENLVFIFKCGGEDEWLDYAVHCMQDYLNAGGSCDALEVILRRAQFPGTVEPSVRKIVLFEDE